MDETLTTPERVPEPGFYYHFKHDPEGPENIYAYEVIGVGHATEEAARSEDRFMVVYRPLYASARAYRLGKLFDLRPLGMFMETVEKPEYQGPRFYKIQDPELIERLKAVRDELYPS